MNLRTLIVDDEPLAREKIRRLLQKEPDVEILAECADGAEAVDAIRAHAPDLVFLDIRMPGLDGFGVIESLTRERVPTVVFVTAYDEYAISAFEVHAADYLLKPVSGERFATAMDRVRRELGQGRTEDLKERLLDLLADLRGDRDYLKRVCVKTSGRVVFLKAEEIDWIDSAGNYVRLHADGESHLLRHTLSGLEERLDPRTFLRIHRSTIVNVERVEAVEPTAAGDHVLILRGGRRLTVSRSYKDALNELLGAG